MMSSMPSGGRWPPPSSSSCCATNQPRWWLAFGLVAGLGLLTKETILFWGFALVVGLLLTPQRRLLFTRWTLFGGLIAFALVLPFLLWNAANGWASVQYWAGYSAKS